MTVSDEFTERFIKNFKESNCFKNKDLENIFCNMIREEYKKPVNGLQKIKGVLWGFKALTISRYTNPEEHCLAKVIINTFKEEYRK